MYPYEPSRTNPLITTHHKMSRAYNEELRKALDHDETIIGPLSEMIAHCIALPLFEMRENGMTSVDGARELVAQNLATIKQETIVGGRFDGASFEVVELTTVARVLLKSLLQQYEGQKWFEIFLDYINLMHWAAINRRLAVSSPVLCNALDAVDEWTCFRIAEITTGRG